MKIEDGSNGKRIFYIDTKKLPKKKSEEYIKDFKRKFEKKMKIDREIDMSHLVPDPNNGTCPRCNEPCCIIFSDNEDTYGATVSDCCEVFIDIDDEEG